MAWDIFVSHAGEDKMDVARPLALLLTDAGYRVWYDEMTLQLGDSLRRKIDEGLARSRFGLVILSPAFFAKEWPQRELDGLSVLEVSGSGRILPVWHNVSHREVARYSPTLADRSAVSTSMGLLGVLDKISAVFAGEGTRDGVGSRKDRVSGLWVMQQTLRQLFEVSSFRRRFHGKYDGAVGYVHVLRAESLEAVLESAQMRLHVSGIPGGTYRMDIVDNATNERIASDLQDQISQEYKELRATLLALLATRGLSPKELLDHAS